MAKYAFQMDGDNVVSGWQGSGSVVPGGTLECTQEQLAEFKVKAAVFPGSNIYRWTYIANVLAEVVDPRPAVTWVDTEDVGVPDGDGNITVTVFDDESAPKITLRHEDDTLQGTVVSKVGNRLMKLDFNNGDALVEVRSFGFPRRDTYESCDLFAMTNKFTINVVAAML